MSDLPEGVELVGSYPVDYQSFLASPYELQVCSLFATGVYDPAKHDAAWLEQLRRMSIDLPGVAIVKATFRRLGTLAAHRDLPGYNYIWFHSGLGFEFEGELVEARAGDLVRFPRERVHAVVDTGSPFYRTNIVTQTGRDAIELWNSEFPTTCWLKDGVLEDWDGVRSIPWPSALI